jgi:UDP-N-acetylmuramoylalanine--D-glutamate ligase
MEPLALPGRHNRRNALIARRCLVALGVPGAGDDAMMRAAAAGYQPLPSRLTTVGVVGGVTFVDDSLSTNVLPTLAALDAFPGRRIALIVGGHDRGIDYAPLAAGVVAREVPTHVLTLPDSGPRIRAALEAAQRTATTHPSPPATYPQRPPASYPQRPPAASSQRHETGISARSNALNPGFHASGTGPAAGGFAGVTDCPDLEAAVTAGFRWAKPDGIVLLSPAAPSFGRFKDYRDRGEAFARAARALT